MTIQMKAIFEHLKVAYDSSDFTFYAGKMGKGGQNSNM